MEQRHDSIENNVTFWDKVREVIGGPACNDPAVARDLILELYELLYILATKTRKKFEQGSDEFNKRAYAAHLLVEKYPLRTFAEQLSVDEEPIIRIAAKPWHKPMEGGTEATIITNMYNQTVDDPELEFEILNIIDKNPILQTCEADWAAAVDVSKLVPF